jgi:hypothetical protein
MFRKPASIFLIVALLFNSCGAYLVFESVKKGIRKEIKRKIKAGVPESELHILRFSNNDVKEGTAGLDWKDDREFKYDGKMYDIVRITYEGNDIIYHCVNDTQEEVLFAKLNEMVKDVNSKDKSAQQKTQHLLQLLIHEALQEVFVLKPWVAQSNGLRYALPNFFSPVFIEIPTPPPDIMAV